MALKISSDTCETAEGGEAVVAAEVCGAWLCPLLPLLLFPFLAWFPFGFAGVEVVGSSSWLTADTVPAACAGCLMSAYHRSANHANCSAEGENL